MYFLRYVNLSLSHLHNNYGIGLNTHPGTCYLLSWKEIVLQEKLPGAQMLTSAMS